MKRARGAGLGDPEDPEEAPAGPSALERASRQVMAESAALRAAVARW
jgi:hypothetical protein